MVKYSMLNVWFGSAAIAVAVDEQVGTHRVDVEVTVRTTFSKGEFIRDREPPPRPLSEHVNDASRVPAVTGDTVRARKLNRTSVLR